MASGNNDSLNSCWKQASGGAGSRFSVLDILGTDKHGGHGGQAAKRMRHSTGGASIDFDITEQQSESMRLSLEKFKTMDADNKLECIFEMLQSIKLSNDNRLENIEQSVRCLSEQSKVTHDEVKLLRYKSIDAEARSRRSNLIFRGMPEQFNEDPLAIIKNFLSDKLDLDSDEVYIQRAHRIGRVQRRRYGPVKHRPIIVAFRDFQDVEMIISSAYKLKGSGFGINRDLPPELLDARKPLWAMMKSEKERNPKAKFTIAYPARLIMDGKVIADTLPDWQQVMRQRRVHFDWQESTTDSVERGAVQLPDRTVDAHLNSDVHSDPAMDVENEIYVDSVTEQAAPNDERKSEQQATNSQPTKGPKRSTTVPPTNIAVETHSTNRVCMNENQSNVNGVSPH